MSLTIVLVETFAVEGLLLDKVLVSFQELNISSKNSKVNPSVIVRCPVVSVKQQALNIFSLSDLAKASACLEIMSSRALLL